METKEALVAAIRSITQDIETIATHRGGLSLLDPATEGYQLVSMRLRLKLQLYRLAGDNWTEQKNLVTCIDKQ